MAEHSPHVLSVEDNFYAVNVGVALKLGQVRGIMLLLAEQRGMEIAEYAPRLVKQTVVGYGNAEKQQVEQMVKILLGMGFPRPRTTLPMHLRSRSVTFTMPDFDKRSSGLNGLRGRMRIISCVPVALILSLSLFIAASGQRRRPVAPSRPKPQLQKPAVEGGTTAVVVDETLSLLRKNPSLFSEALQRMHRGRRVQILGTAEGDGVKFFEDRGTAQGVWLGAG